MTEPQTIRELLDVTRKWFEKKGIESARLDAEILLADTLGEKRLNLYLDLDRPLEAKDVDAYRERVRRRGTSEPVAYILGEREFYGRPFVVTPDVLIPRPDTESVVEVCLEHLHDDEAGLVLDIGTGSGCIAVTLACERKNLRVIATDKSAAALEVARENAIANGVQDRIEFVVADVFATESGALDAGDLVLLVSNPPYIPRSQEAALMTDVRDHEPAIALFGDGEDGLGFYRQILAEAGDRIAPDGSVIFEIGFDQAAGIREIRPAGLSAATVRKDLANNDRIAVFLGPDAKRPGPIADPTPAPEVEAVEDVPAEVVHGPLDVNGGEVEVVYDDDIA